MDDEIHQVSGHMQPRLNKFHVPLSNSQIIQVGVWTQKFSIQMEPPTIWGIGLLRPGSYSFVLRWFFQKIWKCLNIKFQKNQGICLKLCFLAFFPVLSSSIIYPSMVGTLLSITVSSYLSWPIYASITLTPQLVESHCWWCFYRLQCWLVVLGSRFI